MTWRILFHINNNVKIRQDLITKTLYGFRLNYSEAIKSIQILFFNTGTYVNVSFKMVLFSFCQTSSFAKHIRLLCCNHL